MLEDKREPGVFVPQVLPEFVVLHELDSLMRLSERAGVYKRGRSGWYTRSAPKKLDERKDLTLLRSEALRRVPGASSAWLTFARVRLGGQVTPHVDEEPRLLLQFLICLEAPSAGGELLIEGVPYRLEPRDAVIFDANKSKHEVTPVLSGQALFALVALYPRR